QRRRETLARRAIIVVIKSVNRNVVRISRRAGDCEIAGFFGRIADGGTVFSKLASRERLLADAAERENQIDWRACAVGKRFEFAADYGAAYDRACCVDSRGVCRADDYSFRSYCGGLEDEIELNILCRNCGEVRSLFGGEICERSLDVINAGRKLNQSVASVG